MADGSAGRDTVAQEALHLADIRHRPAVRVRRNDLAVHAHFEYPTRAGAKSDLGQLGLKGREQLLGEPGGAQEELTAGAVGNLDAGAGQLGSKE